MSNERRQRTAANFAAREALSYDIGPASHSRVGANTAMLPWISPNVTAETRDGSANRPVVCLDRATASRPELAARPTSNAMTSSIEGQHRLGQQGLESLGRQGYAVGVAGVAALAGRNRLTGK